MSKQPPPAPTASTIGPCPTVIQIVGRPGTGSLPSTIAPLDHPEGGAMVLGKLPVPGRPTIWITVGQGPTALARSGWGLLRYFYSHLSRGWSGGAMVLGKLPVPGRPTIWISVGQGPTALAVGAGGVVWTFLLSSILSLLFLPLFLFGRRPDIDCNTVSKGR